MKRRILIIFIAITIFFCTSSYASNNTTNICNNTVCIYNDKYSNDEILAIDNNGSLWWWYDKGYMDYTTPIKIMDNLICVKDGYAIKYDKSLWKISLDNTQYQEFEVIEPNIEKIMDNVINVASSGGHILVVKDDNTLWGWGDNSYGQIGPKEVDGDEFYDEPQKIMNNVIDISAGLVHSIVLKSDGSLLTMGNNEERQLGNGKNIAYDDIPQKIMEGVKSIYACAGGSFAITEDNLLWRWGSINEFWIGTPDRNFVRPNKPMKYVEDVKDVINPGTAYTLVLKNDDKMWAYGQTKDKDFYFEELPIKLMDNINNLQGDIENESSCILNCNGELYQLRHFSVISQNKENGLKKILDNIRLSENNKIFYTKDFTDISNKP